MDDEEFNLDADILSAPAPSIVSSSASKVIPPTEVNINVSATSSIPTFTTVPAVAVVAPTILKEATAISTVTETSTTSEVIPAATTTAPVIVKGVSLTTTEELKLKRAARFGIAPTAEIVGKIEDSKKTARAERFGIEVKDTSIAKVSSNSNGSKSTVVDIDPKVTEALRKRADRFGVISSVLQEVELTKSVQEQQEKKQKRMERFGTTATTAATKSEDVTGASSAK